jgi:hypothetical protein
MNNLGGGAPNFKHRLTEEHVGQLKLKLKTIMGNQEIKDLKRGSTFG